MTAETLPALDDCFRIIEVSDGRFVAGTIFERKLGSELPDYGRHLVAIYRNSLFHLIPLDYLLAHSTDGCLPNASGS